MKIRRKNNECFNCGANLDSVYNYCPKCGQENNDNNVSVKTLLGDFFNTYLAIDSRFGRTLKPFFINPGFLTIKYTEGKRVSFAHPLRLYLIVSIFYFFTVTLLVKYIAEDENDLTQTSNSNVTLKGIKELNDSTRLSILESLTGNEKSILSKRSSTDNIDSLATFLSALDSARQIEIRNAVGDSTANKLGLLQDSIIADKIIHKNLESDDNTGFNIEVGGEDDHILELIDFDKIDQLDEDYPDISNNKIYDSLDLGDLDYMDDLIARQAIRTRRATKEQLMSYVAQNLPFMMLVLIPLFALILKLLYIRRDELYIKHVIHALHLHSYAYLIFGTFLLLTIYLISDDDWQTVVELMGFVIVSIYTYISFLRVYNQHWFKTIIKFFLTGFIYSFAIMIFFVIEMIISLLLF